MLKDRIREARKKTGLTQQEVAKALGIGKSTYTGYETGNSNPDMYKLAQIMQVLNVDANYLLQDEMAEVHAKDMSQLNAVEVKLLAAYRKLKPKAQQMALGMVESLAMNPAYTQDTSQLVG